MEPGGRCPVQGGKPDHRGERQADQHQNVGADHARQHQENNRNDPGPDGRQVEHPVRVGRIQHLLARLQDFVDIPAHTPALN
jgi:hypothetical protein